MEPYFFLIIATCFAGLIIIAIMMIVRYIVRAGEDRSLLLTVIVDFQRNPSLSLFQFFLWTIVISFGILLIYIIRFQFGLFDFPKSEEFFPSSILVLMGISTAVPVLRTKIRFDKQEKSSDHEISSRHFSKLPARKMKEFTLDELKDKFPNQMRNVKEEDFKKLATNEKQLKDFLLEKLSISAGFTAMLQEDNKVTLTKVQMFIWTWISIIIYLTILFANVIEASNSGIIESIELETNNQTLPVKVNIPNCTDPIQKKDVRCLNMPDLDPTLVALMGLSQVAYLGGEFYQSRLKPDPIMGLTMRFSKGEISKDEFLDGLKTIQKSKSEDKDE